MKKPNSRGLTFDKYVGADSFKETYHVLDKQNSLALKVFRSGYSPERTQRELDYTFEGKLYL
jgi:hypothetical protein